MKLIVHFITQFSFFLRSLIFYILSIKSSIQSTHSHKGNPYFRNKPTSGSNYPYNNRFNVDSAAYTFLCGAENAFQKIDEYVLSSSDSNCYDINMPISFEIIDKENKTIEIHGFLPENGHLIKLSQEYSNICRKIKR